MLTEFDIVFKIKMILSFKGQRYLIQLNWETVSDTNSVLYKLFTMGLLYWNFFRKTSNGMRAVRETLNSKAHLYWCSRSASDL